MNHQIKFVGFLLLILNVSGCASWVVPKPGNITLTRALEEVGSGLVNMKKAQLAANDGKEFSSGLVTADAEVTFNISAEGHDGGKIYIEATPPAAFPVSGKAGGSYETSATTARGNQITIRFRSILFSKKTTTPEGVVIVDGLTDPKIASEVIEVIKKNNISVYAQELKQ